MKAETSNSVEIRRRKGKTPNDIGDMYIKSGATMQNLFRTTLHTIGKECDIHTNIVRQFLDTGMYEPLANVRLPVLKAASMVFGLSFDIDLNSSDKIKIANLPLKPQPQNV